jgi:hypothetical protein
VSVLAIADLLEDTAARIQRAYTEDTGTDYVTVLGALGRLAERFPDLMSDAVVQAKRENPHLTNKRIATLLGIRASALRGLADEARRGS